MNGKDFMLLFMSVGLILGVLYLAGVPIPGITAKRDDDEEGDLEQPASPQAVGGFLNNAALPTIPPPETEAVDTGTPGVVEYQPRPLDAQSGPGKALIDKRMIDLFSNARTRAEILTLTNVTGQLFNELSQPDDFRAYIIQKYGGLNNFPIVPPTVDGGEFVDTMASIVGLTDFTQLAGNGRDYATRQFRNASGLSTGNLWDDEIIGLQAHVGTWGDLPRRRRDAEDGQIARWDRFADDYQAFAENALNLALSLNNALKGRAIDDLRNAGYKFIGYDA